MKGNGKGIEWATTIPKRKAQARKILWEAIERMQSGLKTNEVLSLVNAAASKLSKIDDKERGDYQRKLDADAEAQQDEHLRKLLSEGGVSLPD